VFYRIFRTSLMVAIGAILVAAAGAATAAGIAAARGELAMGRNGGMQAMRMGDGSHDTGYRMGAEAGEIMDHRGTGAGEHMGSGAKMYHGANMGAGAEADIQPMAAQWLMLARGLIRAVASLVPLALIVAAISWVLYRTTARRPELAA
jgi:hypothetical protein